MLLGKKYTRIKRSLNASSYEVTFAGKDGEEIKLPRKLNMLAVICIYSKVNKKAVVKECEKFNKLRELQNKL